MSNSSEELLILGLTSSPQRSNDCDLLYFDEFSVFFENNFNIKFQSHLILFFAFYFTLFYFLRAIISFCLDSS